MVLWHDCKGIGLQQHELEAYELRLGFNAFGKPSRHVALRLYRMHTALGNVEDWFVNCPMLELDHQQQNMPSLSTEEAKSYAAFMVVELLQQWLKDLLPQARKGREFVFGTEPAHTIGTEPTIAT